MHRVDRGVRWILPPHHVDDLGHADRLAPVHQQDRQQSPLLRRTQIDLEVVTPGPDRAQHREPQPIPNQTRHPAAPNAPHHARPHHSTTANTARAPADDAKSSALGEPSDTNH